MTEELGEAIGIDPVVTQRIAAEPRSKVTFDLDQVGDVVKLTVVHDGFPADSTMVGMISEGWPQVLAGLKTLLETGEALPSATERVGAA
jgi:hypothetical protein